MAYYSDDNIKNGLAVEHEVREKNMEVAPHYHNTYELYYLMKGTVKYFINNTVFEMTAGDIVLIPPKAIHNTTYIDDYAERLLIAFDKSFIELDEDDAIFDCFNKQYHYKNVMLRETFTNIEHAYKKNSTTQYRLIKYALMYILMKLSTGHFEHDIADEMSTSEHPVFDAVEYINNNFPDNLPLDEIAKKFSISKCHFSRKFKEVTGIGFSEYILLVRIKHSELLLKESDLSITEISGKCGFNSSSYFTSVFKKQKGMTPFEFRKFG